LDPDNPEALNFVGSLLSAGGRYEEAITYTQRVIDMFPEKPQVWANQAHHLFKMGDIDAARASYREAVRLDDTSRSVVKNFANFEATLKNYPAAIDLYHHLLRLDPYGLPTLKNYTMLLVEAEQDAAAAEAFRKLVTLHPRDLDSRQRYALWLGHTGQGDEAGRQLGIALGLDPENARSAEIGARR